MRSNSTVAGRGNREKGVRVAIPLFGGRVSPHFGASSRFLIVEIAGSKLVGRSVVDLEANGCMQSARMLLKHDVC